MTRLTVILMLASTLVPLAASTATPAPWLTDLETAQQQAAATGKDLFLYFTGSDWCQPCRKLDQEILHQRAFIEAAQQRFVLVVLDFPRRKPLPQAQQAHNETARQHYSVAGYPTIVLADAAGIDYARTGYKRLSPDPYIAHLDDLMARKGHTAELEAAIAGAEVGAAKALALHALVEHNDIVRSPVSIEDVQAIIAADPDDAHGLVPRYQARLDRMQREAAIAAASEAKDLDRQLELIREGLADSGQDAAYRQGLHYRLAWIAVERKDQAAWTQHCNDAIAAAPDSDAVENIRRYRDLMIPHIAKPAKQPVAGD